MANFIDFSVPCDFQAVIDQTEKELITLALHLAHGNRAEAARLLSLKRTTLIAKMKKQGMELHPAPYKHTGKKGARN